jgi:hypothetical protein
MVAVRGDRKSASQWIDSAGSGWCIHPQIFADYEMARFCLGATLIRLDALATFSRSAGEGLRAFYLKPLSRIAGEGEPSPQGLVGEGGL